MVLHGIVEVAFAGVVAPRFFVPENFLHLFAAILRKFVQTATRFRIGHNALHIRAKRRYGIAFDFVILRHVFQIRHGVERVVKRNIAVKIHLRESKNVPVAVAQSRAYALQSVVAVPHEIFGIDESARTLQLGQKKIHRAPRIWQKPRQQVIVLREFAYVFCRYDIVA